MANVNIRGLGPQRTLVLLNGRQQTPVPQRLPGGRFVDVNAFPRMAIQRVEVLKEGCRCDLRLRRELQAVVNFLTRDSFEGLQFSVGHQDIADSDNIMSLVQYLVHKSVTLIGLHR